MKQRETGPGEGWGVRKLTFLAILHAGPRIPSRLTSAHAQLLRHACRIREAVSLQTASIPGYVISPTSLIYITSNLRCGL